MISSLSSRIWVQVKVILRVNSTFSLTCTWKIELKFQLQFKLKMSYDIHGEIGNPLQTFNIQNGERLYV